MAESVCVVVHFLDGSLLKGTTRDFRPNCSSFHLIPADGTSPVVVLCRHLKAIFFVKDLAGKRQRRDPKDSRMFPSPARVHRDSRFTIHWRLSTRL